MRRIAVAFALAFALAACTATEPTANKPSAMKSPEAPLDAKAVEKAFETNLGGQPISSMCDRDKTHTHWACFYEGVEASGPYLRVKLAPDAGVDGDALADTAGRHWFNFVGCDYPKLTTIIVSVNGRDHNVRKPANSINC